MVLFLLLKGYVLGSRQWKGNLDLLNIVMIGLAKEPSYYEEKYELHRLLGSLFSKKLTIDEKLNIIRNEYDISIEDNLREDMNTMCNLSQGIKEKGIAIGEARGEAKSETRIILNMHNNGFTLEQIALAVDKTIEEILSIIENKDCLLQ